MNSFFLRTTTGGAGGGGAAGARNHLLSYLARFPTRQHCRPYVRSRLLLSKFKKSTASPPLHAPPSTTTSSSSSTSSGGFVSWYLGMIESRPILTKGITAGSIFTAADISSQMITHASADSLDWTRTMRMAGYGTLVSGPSLHLWFNFLGRVIPKRDVVSTLKKMFLGQTVYGPIINSVFFSVNAALQGETPAEIHARLKRDLIPTIKSGLIYWPLCDFMTFKFIPVRLQPLVSNSFSFLWTVYITYMASLEKASVEKTSADSA